jgi:hypothetical protein
MGLADEWDQMVFAQRSEGYVLDHDHLVVVCGKGNGKVPTWIIMRSLQQLGKHRSHSGWSSEQSFSSWILPDG